MSDLNILHAQNADVKSRVSDSGLACDSPASAPDRKDVEAFERAMGKKGQSQADEFNLHYGMGEKGQSQADEFNLHYGMGDDWDLLKADDNMQSPLSSLFSMVSTFNDVEAAVRVDAPRAMLSADDLNMLVERILVSAANDGTQEVRLILNESVLSGTEIVLNRSLTGQLVVALNCVDASTFQTLVASQFDLKHKLEEHEATTVQVSVNIQQENNDAEQRSRGYFAYDPTHPWNRDNA